jgi:hypothetical protein
MPKDKTKCRICQFREINYTTSVTGLPVAHGLCRECFEKLMARRPGAGGYYGFREINRCRSREKQEDIYATKYGRD